MSKSKLKAKVINVTPKEKKRALFAGSSVSSGFLKVGTRYKSNAPRAGSQMIVERRGKDPTIENL
jgi:hypothetical protein